jgi:glycosyltransferase involved in cell wall biosynthesis
MKISIVVPVYNGEHTVLELHKRIDGYFKSNGNDFEVIYVYDCGVDRSWEKLLEIKNSSPANVLLIKLSRNFGQHNALICGFEYCSGDFIVTLDEDLQHDPYDIDLLITKQIQGDYDVVYGYSSDIKFGLFRRLTSACLKKLVSIGIPEIHNDYSAFRLIKRSIGKSMVEMRNSYTFLDGYISWITNSVESCEVSHNFRFAGKSSYTLSKLIQHSINIFVTFSNLPVRILSRISIFLFIIVLFYAFYIIFRKIYFDDLLLGFPTIIIGLGFGVSLIMMSLAIIGEYIYRINLKTTKRPNYHIFMKL